MIKEIRSKKELTKLHNDMNKWFKYMVFAALFSLIITLAGAIIVVFKYILIGTFDIINATGTIAAAVMACFFLILATGFLIQQRYYDIIYRLDKSLK